MSTVCSVDDYPFVFYDTNDELVNGTLVGNSCIFPEANCNPGVPTKECCDVNSALFPGVAWQYMLIGMVLCNTPLYWGIWQLWKSMSPEEKAIMSQEEKERRPRFITNRKLPSILKNTLLTIWEFGLMSFVVATICIGIYLKQSEQANMTVTERNSLAAAEAFMEPFYTVFTFVEDIILIRVSYAMVQNDKGLTDRLIHMGLAGVIVTGTLAGLVGTLLGAFERTLAGITIPGLANDKLLYPGCSFVESIDISMVLPYWMMESWGCMGTQISGVLTGFLMGAYEYDLMGWIGLISWGVFSWIWFGNVTTYPNPLTLLGLAEFSKDWLMPFLYLGFLLCPMGAQVRERTGLELSIKKVFSYMTMPFRKKQNDVENELSDAEIAARKKEKKEVSALVKQGIQLMFIEIILQGCMSCSIYLSLNADGAVAYKITALQSELPIYGHAYAYGMALVIKIVGPMLLTDGTPKVFVDFIKCNLWATLGLVILIISVTVPFFDGLAISSGKNACAYASSSECLPYFDRVMGENGQGGIFTLPFTYTIFPLASSLETILLVVRSVLLICLEFDFMVKATIAAGISYIPAIAIVQYAPLDFQQQAIAYFGAFYVPQVVLIGCSSVKLVSVLGKITRGEPGPWSQKKEKRHTMMFSNQDSDMARKAIATADAEQEAADYSNHDEIED